MNDSEVEQLEDIHMTVNHELLINSKRLCHLKLELKYQVPLPRT